MTFDELAKVAASCECELLRATNEAPQSGYRSGYVLKQPNNNFQRFRTLYGVDNYMQHYYKHLKPKVTA